MSHTQPIDRIVDLTDVSRNTIFNMTTDEARALVAAGDPAKIRGIDGDFALVAISGLYVRMARSIGRPLRYFIAKRKEGPALIASDRIDAIYGYLKEHGLADQFHPSYTRMVPAHHVTDVALVGCPDPNPTYTRYFAPRRNDLPADPETIGRAYIGALSDDVGKWLRLRAADGPIGVCFSGGVDSGSVFLVVYHAMLRLGMNPSRLKAFTLAVDGGGEDLDQSQRFLEAVGLGLFLEAIEVPSSAIDWREAVRVMEDYKPLDVQSGAMALALCRGIRARYPDWRYLVDGDGGDENLKDYPIEENPELTIRSVLNNRMLYQEGWGVDAIKHSLTYSGGLSRGYARTYAPAAVCGFDGFSPYTLPNVMEVAEAIPFIELTDWSHERLYALKGDIVARGVKAVTGIDMPIYPKRRFQHGRRGARRFPPFSPLNHPYTVGLIMPPTIPEADVGRWVASLRPAKNPVDTRRPYAFFVEPERSENGVVEDTATLFLVNRECPFRCLMCDLWRNTTDLRVPDGAIVRQVEYALARLPATPHIKLYNAGNFFDAQAVPPGDLPRIAELLAPFRTAVVECHPRLIGPRCLEFRDRLRPALRVAMGLETAHPEVLRRLNKGMTLDDFERAAGFLRRHGIGVRAFLLLRPPFLDEAEGVEWAKRSLRYAFDVGVECCVVIPTRDGNGAMERLRAEGQWAPPRLESLEEVLAYGVGLRGGRVFADLWDIEKLFLCPRCGPARAPP